MSENFLILEQHSLVAGDLSAILEGSYPGANITVVSSIEEAVVQLGHVARLRAAILHSPWERRPSAPSLAAGWLAGKIAPLLVLGAAR